MKMMFGLAAAKAQKLAAAQTKSAISLAGLRMQSDLGRLKPCAVIPLQDCLVRLVVIGETEFRAVPPQFLAGITRRFHGQQRRFRNPPADLERSPQMLLLAVAIIDPILPMIVPRDFRQRLIIDRFAFAENRQPAIR